MSAIFDWQWKIREAVDQVRSRYELIGRNTGAPFLAVIYPPEVERAFLREWRIQSATLKPDFSVRPIDVRDVTSRAVQRVGVEALVEVMNDPMPGADPDAEVGTMWTSAVATAVRQAEENGEPGKPVVVLERLAALYPASGPRAVMQALWDSDHAALVGPVVLLVPGVLVQPRVYRFVGLVEELMYRGDIL